MIKRLVSEDNLLLVEISYVLQDLENQHGVSILLSVI